MSSSYRTIPDKFLVAFSFAGEQRELVRSIAEAVEQRLGRGTVFYDMWFEHYLAGSAADLKLQRIYAEQSELVVFCPSQKYGEKKWTIAEWDAIRDRHTKLRADPDRNAADRILPLRVAEGDVEGLLDNAIWADARKCAPKQTAELIVHRLRQFAPDAGRPRVFLAECTSDLEDEEKPVNRQRLQTFLEEDLEWVVLPRSPLTEPLSDQYRSLLEAELKQCLAFVQLLGPVPWKGGGFDRIQHDAAAKLGLPLFRFRGELDLPKLKAKNSAQHEFVTAAEIIAGSFEDFKVHLREKLNALVQEWELGENEESRPLVRVAIRAQQDVAVWDPVFQLLFEEKGILCDALVRGQTFKDKHVGEPCHGFLILCDAAALDDGPHSPRSDMEHCRLIQYKEKDSSRRPPVGLVYWPPPPLGPSWAKLLRSTPDPKRLHRVLGDSLADLGKFIEQVREVRRASS